MLVQEAFTDEAKKLAKVAGYDFVATGPSAASDAVQPPLGMKFDGAARWAKGERTGSLADSGLLVLSDYPIVKTLRFAFPEGACAGFDCLAAKGVLVAWIAVPGAREPIAFVNTHLNSRRAAHVPKARSDTAYAWQISAVRNFLMREISPNAAVIIGGDLNIGKSPNRRAAYSALPLLGPRQIDGLSSAKIMRVSTPEAEHIAVLNKDKIISRSGKNMTLTPVRAWVLFEKSTIDEPLSDHAGFVVNYRFTG